MTSEDKNRAIGAKLEKAAETIREAELLMEHKMWNAAVNRIYYACFYAVGALLAKIDVSAKTHAGVIQMFSHHYVNIGSFSKETIRFYVLLFTMRQSGDYKDDLKYEEADVAGLLQPAKEMIAVIERYVGKQE